MAKWVLIFWVIGGSGAGLSSAEFDSKDSCYKALEQIYSISNRWRGWRTMDGFCTEK